MTRIEVTAATTRSIERDHVAAFGDAVGDRNPVHFDPAFAASAGLPDTVVHGPLTTAIIIDQVIAQVGAANLRNLDVRLRGPVFPGDAFTLAPIEYGELDRGVEVTNQRGEQVATVILILEGDPDT